MKEKEKETLSYWLLDATEVWIEKIEKNYLTLIACHQDEQDKSKEHGVKLYIPMSTEVTHSYIGTREIKKTEDKNESKN